MVRNAFDFEHPVPSIEGIRARLAATPEFEERGVKRPPAIPVLLNLLEQRDRRAAEHAFRVAELASTREAYAELRVESQQVQDMLAKLDEQNESLRRSQER